MQLNAPFVIWGSAGHARVVADAIGQYGGRVVALFDNNPEARSALVGIPLHFGRDAFLKWRSGNEACSGAVAIGGSRGSDRLGVMEFMSEHGITFPVIVHPAATIHADTKIGVGSHVLAGTIVAAGTSIGRACIINHRAGVDHECVLGDGVHIAPGATLCGCINVGSHAFIGAGAVIVPRTTIGEGAIVGAGAVVLADVPPYAVVVGNPARRIR